MKKFLVVLTAMVCLAFLASQALAKEIRVTGNTDLVTNTVGLIKGTFSFTTDQWSYFEVKPTSFFRNVRVAFIEDDLSISSMFELELFRFDGGHTLPSELLCAIQVFFGPTLVMTREYRAGDAVWEEMFPAHSGGLDVHQHVSNYKTFLEVVIARDGNCYVKYIVASKEWALCYFKVKVSYETRWAHVPLGWSPIPFPGDGNPEVLTLGLFVRPN